MYMYVVAVSLTISTGGVSGQCPLLPEQCERDLTFEMPIYIMDASSYASVKFHGIRTRTPRNLAHVRLEVSHTI